LRSKFEIGSKSRRVARKQFQRSAGISSHSLTRAAFFKNDLGGAGSCAAICKCTAAGAMALGMHRWGQVDVVLSGINLGLNLGNSCWHSGTLAAAKQAALLGSRGIAFSTNVSDNREPEFTALEPYVIRVLHLLLRLKTLSLVNVNLPEKPKGIRWTRQSVRHYDGKVVPDKDPAGRPIFWFTVTPLQGAA
jgi:5'-nucleotidase